MTILEKMLENCKKAGYCTTENVEKVARANIYFSHPVKKKAPQKRGFVFVIFTPF